MSYVTPEAIARARSVDLLSYFQAFEPGELVRCGANEYCTKTHDSLKISHGLWYWWSHGIGGKSALDYLIKARGIDFVKAVEILSGTVALPSTVRAEPVIHQNVLYMPEVNYDCTTVKQYLMSRGIDGEIIDDCIAEKSIGEEADNGYALFIGYDEKGTMKHCAVRATDGKDFKKDVSGSNKKYTFRLMSKQPIHTLRVFECAVDLLSFATLEKERGGDYKAENLLSLSGIYLPKSETQVSKIPSAIVAVLDAHPEIDRVYLHFDNDYTGRRGAYGMIAALGDRYTVSYVPPPRGKDFNDYLKIKEQIVKTERERE